jgi:hypothetical protein
VRSNASRKSLAISGNCATQWPLKVITNPFKRDTQYLYEAERKFKPIHVRYGELPSISISKK